MSVRMMEQMQPVNDNIRQFIPTEQGESLDDQIFPWSLDGISEDMYDRLMPHEADPTTLSNIMQMMAVEMQHWMDYHAFSKWTSDQEMKSLLGSIARAEHVHHMKLMSLLPIPHAPAEMVLMSEVSLLTGYNMCMQHEPNDSVRSAFTHIFSDHLMHADYAADKVNSMGCDANVFTGGASLSGGRSLNQQFMKPEDTVWQGRFDGCFDKNTADPLTMLNVDMSLAGEVAAWNGYHCAIENTEDNDTALNFSAFMSVEEQHLGILGSLVDPNMTLLERSLVHEQVEMQNYGMMMRSEPDDRVRGVFEDLYREDMEQARLFGQLAR